MGRMWHMASSLDFFYRHTSERRLLLWHCAQCATSEGKRNTFSILLVRCFLSSKVSSDYDINEHRFRTLHALIPLPATTLKDIQLCCLCFGSPHFRICASTSKPPSSSIPFNLEVFELSKSNRPGVVSGCWRLCVVFPKARVLTRA